MFVQIVNCERHDGWYRKSRGDTTGMVFEVKPKNVANRYHLIMGPHNDKVLSELRGVTLKNGKGSGLFFSGLYIEEKDCVPYEPNNKNLASMLDKEY